MPEVTDAEIESLACSILTRYGIDFTCYEPKSLKRRIVRILSLERVNTVHELWRKFLAEPSFIQRFMNEVSVGMTSMFRDPIFWKKLNLLLTTEFKGSNLDIWHAGCSTGEEVYSMGILLRETLLLEKSRRWATDINLQAIDTAKSGVYHKIKMLENEKNFRAYNATGNFDLYCDTLPDQKYMQMKPYLIKNVEFGYQNLISDGPKGRFQLVLCRNVMIYFDGATKVRVLDKLHTSLNPGGLLAIGFYDTLLPFINSSKFRLLDEEAKILQKI